MLLQQRFGTLNIEYILVVKCIVKKSDWQNLENSWKKLKNHWHCFLEKHLIGGCFKITFEENIFTENNSSKNITNCSLTTYK